MAARIEGKPFYQGYEEKAPLPQSPWNSVPELSQNFVPKKPSFSKSPAIEEVESQTKSKILQSIQTIEGKLTFEAIQKVIENEPNLNQIPPNLKCAFLEDLYIQVILLCCDFKKDEEVIWELLPRFQQGEISEEAKEVLSKIVRLMVQKFPQLEDLIQEIGKRMINKSQNLRKEMHFILLKAFTKQNIYAFKDKKTASRLFILALGCQEKHPTACSFILQGCVENSSCLDMVTEWLLLYEDVIDSWETTVKRLFDKLPFFTIRPLELAFRLYQKTKNNYGLERFLQNVSPEYFDSQCSFYLIKKSLAGQVDPFFVTKVIQRCHFLESQLQDCPFRDPQLREMCQVLLQGEKPELASQILPRIQGAQMRFCVCKMICRHWLSKGNKQAAIALLEATKLEEEERQWIQNLLTPPSIVSNCVLL